MDDAEQQLGTRLVAAIRLGDLTMQIRAGLHGAGQATTQPS